MRKKVFFAAVFLLTMLFAVVGWARLITVGSSGCDYTSIRAVFINEDLEPGDIVEVRADILGGSKTYYETGVIRWYAEDSGTPDNPVVLRGREGDSITVSVIGEIDGWDESSNWTDDGSNIWHMTYSHTPGRLFINGEEIIRAESLSGINATYKWYYDTSNTLLYVYSEGNPATTYNSMKGSTRDEVLLLSGCTGVKIENLLFEGGYARSIYLVAAQYVTIQNCSIGRYAVAGIVATENSSDHTPSTNLLITNNTIESGLVGSYDHEHIGLNDGISLFRGVTNSTISKNYIANWGHSCLSIGAASSTYHGTYNNTVIDNTFSGENVSYCRAFGVGGSEGKCYNNVITRNLIRNFTVRSQVNGDHNKITYNLIVNMTNSPCKTYGTAQGIELQAFDPDVCHDNIIANNIIINCEEAGIRFRHDVNNKENNIIANNIIYNCGTNSKNGLDGYGIVVDNASDILNNTFQNNLVYNPGISNVVYYRGTAMTVSTWNDSDNSGDVIEGNLQADPLLTPNYHLSAGSPCIDAGVKVTGVHFGDYWKDLDGNSEPWGSAPDIGCYEYNTGEIGWTPGWFVRPAGGDYGNEDGTSYENAWDGFSDIVWGAGGVQAGDTLWICGTHNITSSFEIEVSGSSDNYVITRMDYPSDLGLINGSDTANQPIYINQKSYIKLLNCRVTGGAIHGINIYNSNHILLIGCEVYGNARNGITISDSSFNVTIFSCKSHDNGTAEQISSGILISSFSNNINVTRCLLYQNGRFDSTDGRGITVQTGAHDVVISDCQMWNNGIGDGSGLEVYDADHVTLQRCKIKGSVNAIEARGHDSTNYPNSANYLKVYYCLLEAEKTGILYGNYPVDGGQECEYGEFYNNTIIVPRIGIDIYSPNNSIVNNIIKIPAGEYSAIYFRYMTEDEIDTCTQDYNYVQFVSGSHYVIAYPEDGSWHAYDTVASWHSAHPNLAEHDVIVDDLALLSNYHLSRNSPCIDAGIKLPIHDSNWRDLAGNRIRYGTAPDIGCYEYKTWPLGAWGMLPWIGGRHKVQWTPYE